MALFSNKKGIKQAKEAAGSMQYAAAVGMEATQAYQAQLMAAEMAKLQVYTKLGAPGTYGPGAAEAAAASPAGSVYDTTSQFSKPNQGLMETMPYVSDEAKKGLLGSSRTGILDPEAYASKIAQSSSFRTRSALTAEAEQLANREGELYDRLENSILGVIHEQSAISLRDQLREQRTAGARRGGTARSATTLDLRRISIMETNMQSRIQQTWEANRDLNTLIQKTIANTQAGNIDFLANLPGTNAAFMKAMEESAKMHVEAGKMSAEIAKNAYDVKQSQQPVNFWNGLAEGLISMAAGWALGEMEKGGPAGLMRATGEQLQAGAEYTKGLMGNKRETWEINRGEQVDQATGDAGKKVSGILGWQIDRGK
jgi:hypothetical protein